jgi:hypothetical protein
MKKTMSLSALILLTAVAAIGCDRGVNVIDFAGQETAANSESVTPTENTENSGDTITPENTGSPSTDTGTTEPTPEPETPTNTGSDTHEEKYCPAGWASEDGNGTLCCRDDNPQICMIIDPVPPGGVKPGIFDHLPTDVVVVDPTPPTPPPGGTGGGGSGGLDDPEDPDCYHKGPYGDRGMERMNNHTTTGDIGLGPVRGCVMM